MERETGIEPAAPTLARSCSTTELFPHSLFKKTIVIVSKLNNKSQGFVKIFNSLLKTDCGSLLVAMSIKMFCKISHKFKQDPFKSC